MEYLSNIIEANDTVNSWEVKRADIRKRVLSIIGEPPVKKVPLDAEVVEEIDGNSYLRQKVVFSVESDERISAYLLIPKGITAPVPAILCPHGTTGAEGKDVSVGIAKRGRNQPYAHELSQRGYITFVIDAIAMGERIPKGHNALDTTEFYKRHPGWSAHGKMVWDYGCALDYLSSLKNVDSSRFGSIGHSFGSTLTLFLAALDKRIVVSVASCGIGSWEGNSRKLEWARDPAEHGFVFFPKLRPIFLADKSAPFEFHELISLIAPRALLRLSAYSDEIVVRPDIIAESSYKTNQVYKLLGAEENFAQYFHGDGHNFLSSTRALAYAWFDRHFQNSLKQA